MNIYFRESFMPPVTVYAYFVLVSAIMSPKSAKETLDFIAKVLYHIIKAHYYHKIQRGKENA